MERYLIVRVTNYYVNAEDSEKEEGTYEGKI